MALPYVFANVTELDTPQLDANFNALGALTVIPCTASGTNTIVLTPISNTPTIAAYASRAPLFGFVAQATSTGPVTINVSGVGASNLYKQHGAAQASTNDLLIGGVYYVAFDSSLNSGGGGFVLISDQTATAQPNIQIFLSGTSQTYTVPAGAVYLDIFMVAGGGGGSGASANNGNGVTASTDTTWVTAGGTWQAVHGNGGTAGSGGAGGTGGTGGTSGSGTQIQRLDGGNGWGGSLSAQTSSYPTGMGGVGTLGGPGMPAGGLAAGGNAKANTGAGGAGGADSGRCGSGGGAGESVRFMITALAATYTYTVGQGGVGGVAGGQAGGNGAAGRIEVLAYF